ncbi:phytoene desaturase family protein [Nonomuraea pusilla]|uniref:Phytoene dehydrogenase-related protein n=1 Tax=Nonomuraea pusilla TaxID=46177 RepID=A0A1H7MY07_9ACTN|nr:NAD(P)/FAD-dependent oxidoreductase [Nonomuraea pusilla]SEL15951.1 Phytoene dehydrogenase-related protein [Nonomuraea pusilla]
MSADAVVVGSGPNGLVAALLLARAGRRVLLLEGAERFGGGLRSGPLTLPGHVHDLGATVMAMALASPAFHDLGVSAATGAPAFHDLGVSAATGAPSSPGGGAAAGGFAPLRGVEFAHPPVAAAHPLDGRPAVLVHRNAVRTGEGLGRDGAAWRAAAGAVARAGFPLMDLVLKPLGPWRAPLGTFAAAAAFGAAGLLPATTFARRAFRTVEGRAVFAGMAAHSVLDLRAPLTTGYGLMLAGLAHLVGWPLVRGGSQVLADALVAALRELGGEAVSGHPVRRLDELSAETIVLDVTPRQFLAMADLPPRYRRALRRHRYGPGVFKLDWALDGPVPWRDPAVAGAGTVHLGGTLEEIALSEAEMAAGRHSPRPFVLLVQPYAADPTRGGHTLYAYCHVPNGSAVDMTGRIESQIERFAPGFRDRVLARHASGPADLEAGNPNLVGGDIGGGLASLVQFLRRPVWSPAPWRTPLPGVFLCSSSTPPGGGTHGMGGWQAARLALRGR